MRLGWVVGHAGLTGSIVIILIAHVISIATGLSISSIATNKKVGAGGVYYVLSRSLGLPMGGAIGYTLFIATSFSIALYLIGFAENFNPVLGLGSTVNDFRISGTIALAFLTAIVYISTSVAIKSQYFIMAAIVLSLGAIILGNPDAVTPIGNFIQGESDVSFAVLFGIFFPAVTGFTAGIAMSGDLENPKRDIPIGTLLSIGVGLIIYLGLAFFLDANVDSSVLKSNYNVLMDIALFAPLVIAGIWGATLSSALGGLLGGPRIYQAMSIDNIAMYSKVFSQGTGKAKEPRNALILTIVIAEIGVLMGELDTIARLVSMFYLMAYNFINLSFFLESWANSDFSPKFKVSKWIGAIGFVATFTVMFQIDPVAMVLAYLLLFGTYFFLKRNQISLNSGDIWGSVWSSVVKAGLRKMDGMEENQNYWRPNVLLFSGGTDKRPHLIELSQDIGGRSGMISNFDLIESPDAAVLFPKKDKGVKTADIREDGIFTRRQEVRNIYNGIETIASVYGFSGIEPNSVLMGWPRKTSEPLQFANLTQSLIDLDYNVLYMDYDEERGFGKYETIDLWWRGVSNNVILTIRLVKFLLASQRWANAHVRVLLVNDDHLERGPIHASILEVLNDFRLSAEVKIINNSTEKLSIFELMKHYSNYADLVFVGVPDKIYDPETYVEKTNNLLDSIGTTMLVRASSQFSEISLGFKPKELTTEIQEIQALDIEPLQLKLSSELKSSIETLEKRLQHSNKVFTEKAIAVVVSGEAQFFLEYERLFEKFFSQIMEKKSRANFRFQYQELSEELQAIGEGMGAEHRDFVSQILESEIEKWVAKRQNVFTHTPNTIKRYVEEWELIEDEKDNWDIKWTKKILKAERSLFGKCSLHVDWSDLLNYYESTINLRNMKKLLHELGMIEAINVKALRERTVMVIEQLLTEITLEPENRSKLIGEAKKAVLDGLKHQAAGIQQKPEQLLKAANFRDREMVLKIVELSRRLDVNSTIEDIEDEIDFSKEREDRQEINNYAEFWERNQELFSNLFKAWTVTTGLHIELVYLKENVSADIRVGIFGMFRRLSKHLRNLFEKEGLGVLDEQRIQAFDENELLGHNPSEFLGKLQEKLRDNIGHLPETVDLIDEDSILNFEDYQEGDVKQISIELQRIADYFIELDFIEPMNRRVEHSYHVITARFEEMGSRIAFINSIEENPSQDSELQLKELKSKLISDLDELDLDIDRTEMEFLSALEKQFGELTQKLSVSELQHTSSGVNRFVHIKQGYKGIFEQFKNYRLHAKKWVNSSVFEIRRKQHQLRMAEFNDRNKTLVNKRKMLKTFVQKNSIVPEVERSLPTYYRHLFAGKQMFHTQLAVKRDFELEQALSALGPYEAGALLVISEPLGGKSHFAESVIQGLNARHIFRVFPPGKGINQETSLLEVFQKVTNQQGNFAKIMNNVPMGSVFVLNKLELWWLRKNGGGKHIDQLSRVIEQYGDRHKFILSMNNFAYDLVRQVTRIESVLCATIILPPVNKTELAKLMLERHHLSGVDIRFSKKPERVPSQRELLRHFEKFANNANGNVGVSMMRWLASIERFEKDTVYISHQPQYKMPILIPGSWAVLLTHLVLHERLHLHNIFEIFHLQDRSTVNGVIKELKFTGLIKEIGLNTFTIEPSVSKSVIEELKNQNYLKNLE